MIKLIQTFLLPLLFFSLFTISTSVATGNNISPSSKTIDKKARRLATHQAEQKRLKTQGKRQINYQGSLQIPAKY